MDRGTSSKKLVLSESVNDPQGVVQMAFEEFGATLGCQIPLQPRDDDDEPDLGAYTRKGRPRMPAAIRDTINQALQGCDWAHQSAGLFRKNLPESIWEETWSEEIGGVPSKAGRKLVHRTAVARFSGTVLTEYNVLKTEQ